MSQFSSSGIGRAEVEVTANIEPLKQKLAEAEESVRKFAGSVGSDNKAIVDELFGPLKKELADYQAKQAQATQAASAFSNELLLQVGLATATAAAMYSLGNEIGTYLEKVISGGKDSDFAETKAERIGQIRKEIEELKKTATGDGTLTKIDDYLSNGTDSGVFYSDRAKALAKIAELRKEQHELEKNEEQVAHREQLERTEQRRAKEAESLRIAIENEHIATLEGVERLEAARAKAKESARAKYGEGSGDLIQAIDARYDHEIERFKELEAKKQAADEERQRQSLLDIEDRKRAYNDLIQFQKQRDREHAEAMAESLAKAMKTAYSEMTKSLALDRLVTTMEALSANMEKLTRQRFAQG